MGKKEFGTNSKKEDAKERKEQQKQDKKVKEEKIKEDAKWVDNDKKAGKKMDKEQIAEFKEVFQIFDEDSDGLITGIEVRKIFQSIGMDLKATGYQRLVDEAFQIGTLDFDAFLSLLARMN